MKNKVEEYVLDSEGQHCYHDGSLAERLNGSYMMQLFVFLIYGISGRVFASQHWLFIENRIMVF